MRGHLASLKASAAKPGTTASQLQADLDGERLAHIETRNELRTLRDQLVSLEAARSKAADATTAAGLQISLESERAAHEKTRATLKALEERTAALDAAARRQDQELRRTTEELASARTDGQRWQARLLQIEAEMQRQTAARRGAGEVQTALPSPPTPFSGTSPPAASPPAAEATSLKTAPESAATDSPPPETTAPVTSVSPATLTVPARPPAAAPLRSSLDAGLANSVFDLQLMAVPELVQGKPGSYYRIVCRETPGGKRLKFVSGGYSIAGGEARLAACVKALSSDVLSVIPAGVPKILYVQAFASRQGFARPQPIAASDEQLKALSYLARVGEAPIFASSPRQQTVASTFDNSHLPLLRAGSIADWVETFTKEAVSPVLLEGEFRDNGEEVSRSFDFIVYVKW